MDIKVTMDDNDAQRKLRLLETAVSDLRPFWGAVIPLFHSWMRRQFDSEGAFAGTPWAPLSPVYALTKTGGKGILQASGQLRQAASRVEQRRTPHSLTLSIDDGGANHPPVLQYHQSGTDRMPARPLVFGDPLPATAQMELEEAAERYVREITARL